MGVVGGKMETKLNLLGVLAHLNPMTEETTSAIGVFFVVNPSNLLNWGFSIL